MMNKYNPLVIILLSALITACIYSDPRRPSAQTVAELRTLGITLSPAGLLRDPESSVCSVDMNSITGLFGFKFYLSPDPDYATRQAVSDLVVRENERVGNAGYPWRPYDFRFSTVEGSEYVQIPPVRPSNNINSVVVPFQPALGQYYGSVSEQILLPDYVLYGDYYLVGEPRYYPVAATHAELWFRESIGAEPKLVSRVALESLVSWQSFTQPYIDISSGTALCVEN